MDLNKIRDLMALRDNHLLNSEETNRETLYALADVVPDLMGEIRRLEYLIYSLCDGLTARRAMEPKHSDPEHECPECGLLAEIRRSEMYRRRPCRKHEWVDARDKFVEKCEEVCLQCGAIR